MPYEMTAIFHVERLEHWERCSILLYVHSVASCLTRRLLWHVTAMAILHIQRGREGVEGEEEDNSYTVVVNCTRLVGGKLNPGVRLLE